MKQPVDYLFPPVDEGSVPYWRLVLRGFSQICFQSNELTGLFFFAAVLVASPIGAAYLLVAGLMAPAASLLIAGRGPLIAQGLPGLNPGLLALALSVFFATGWTDYGMWAVLLAGVVATILLSWACIAILPFPALAFPFLIVFWVLYALAPELDVLKPLSFSAMHGAEFHPVVAVFLSLGQAIFSPTLISGILFGIGVFLSNWRHGILAVCGAAIGTAVAYYYREVDAASANLGLYGFNGVLTAVAVFVVCGGKFRLAVLGAIVATILTPVFGVLGLQSLSAPFVFTTWLMLALGWFDEKFGDGGPKAPPAPSQENPAREDADIKTRPG